MEYRETLYEVYYKNDLVFTCIYKGEAFDYAKAYSDQQLVSIYKLELLEEEVFE